MKVYLTIIGKRTADGDTEVTELTTDGLMRPIPGGWEVRYRQEEDGVRIDSLVRVTDGYMEVERRGAASSLLRLQAGKRLESDYDTGFGCLRMAVDTRQLEWDLSDRGGKIKTRYQLEINGTMTADHELTVTVRATEL